MYGLSPVPQVGGPADFGLRPVMTLDRAGSRWSSGSRPGTACQLRPPLRHRRRDHAGAGPARLRGRHPAARLRRRPGAGRRASGGRSPGRVAMDQFVVDLGGDDRRRRATRRCSSAPATAASRPPRTGRGPAGTIAYEIVTRIGARVPRASTVGGRQRASGVRGRRAAGRDRRRSERRGGRGERGRRWRRAGLVGRAIGVVAAGAAAGRRDRAAHRRPGHAPQGRGSRSTPTGPYGTLRGAPGTAIADDGTELYYEVDDVAPPAAAPPARRGWRPALRRARPRRRRSPSSSATATASTRTPGTSSAPRCAAPCGPVYWDQRSHGRSERGRDQLAGEPATIDQLGRDLKAVLDAAAPEGPVVLVGHSMGGMTVMALADQYPELVRERVAGVALRRHVVRASWPRSPSGLPVGGRAGAVRALAPGRAARRSAARPTWWSAGRRATADLFAGIIKRYSFGSEDVDPAVGAVRRAADRGARRSTWSPSSTRRSPSTRRRAALAVLDRAARRWSWPATRTC